MIIRDIPTFDYFSDLGISFDGKKILDFGCNKGNLLRSSNGKIAETQYTGIDVDGEALEAAKSRFPYANWIFYNRKNHLYNPEGDSSDPPLKEKYDLILSYSVFSHMDIDDTVEILRCLFEYLYDGASIYFTYCNVNNPLCVEYFLDRRIRKYGRCDPLVTPNYLYLINNRTTKKPPTEPCERFVSLYDEKWLLEVLDDFNPVSLSAPKKWQQECMKVEWFQDCIWCSK